MIRGLLRSVGFDVIRYPSSSQANGSTKVSDLESRLTDYQSKLQELQRSISGQDSQGRNLEERATKSEARSEFLKGRISDYEAHINELGRNATKLKAELHHLQSELNRLNQELAIARAQPDYDYDSDGLRVVGRSVGFLSNERFKQAYSKGINSGHRFGSDVGIEWRVHTACWAALQCKDLDGDFVECGVNTGIVSLAICNYLDFSKLNKKLYLFDTYCGIPLEQAGQTEKSNADQYNSSHYWDCFEVTKQNFAHVPNAILVRGKVPDTLNDVKIEKVAYLHIDMNIAYPEIEALKFFWPKLSPRAFVLLDDYGFKSNYEQMEAMDNLASKLGVEILTLPTGQGLIVRP